MTVQLDQQFFSYHTIKAYRIRRHGRDVIRIQDATVKADKDGQEVATVASGRAAGKSSFPSQEEHNTE